MSPTCGILYTLDDAFPLACEVQFTTPSRTLRQPGGFDRVGLERAAYARVALLVCSAILDLVWLAIKCEQASGIHACLPP